MICRHSLVQKNPGLENTKDPLRPPERGAMQCLRERLISDLTRLGVRLNEMLQQYHQLNILS